MKNKTIKYIMLSTVGLVISQMGMVGISNAQNAMQPQPSLPALNTMTAPAQKTIIEQNLDQLQKGSASVGAVHAETQEQENTTTAEEKDLSKNNVSNVGVGNATEAELTPMLREVAAKKSEVQMLELNNKIVELKVQLKENTSKLDGTYVDPSKVVPTSTQATPTSTPVVRQMSEVGFAGKDVDTVQVSPQLIISYKEIKGRDELTAEDRVRLQKYQILLNQLKVKRIYGPANNLTAVVDFGDAQKNVVVKAGDLLPLIGKISSIKPRYIEIPMIWNPRTKKSEPLRFFVTDSGEQVQQTYPAPQVQEQPQMVAPQQTPPMPMPTPVPVPQNH